MVPPFSLFQNNVSPYALRQNIVLHNFSIASYVDSKKFEPQYQLESMVVYGYIFLDITKSTPELKLF